MKRILVALLLGVVAVLAALSAAWSTPVVLAITAAAAGFGWFIGGTPAGSGGSDGGQAAGGDGTGGDGGDSGGGGGGDGGGE